MREFRDDDAGYLTWLATHPDGYVLNISRSHRPADARLHHASCRTINGPNVKVGKWTAAYVKVCAEQVTELDQWATGTVGQPIPPCPICHPPHPSARPASEPNTPAAADLTPEDHSRFHGPVAGQGVVEAWADNYIHFEHRPHWQEHLRTEIRSRCRQLKPAAEQVLHATFFGPKPASADIENLVLYNIDTFKAAGHNGIRFEHGATVPPAPDGTDYPFCYRYALAPRSGAFTDWRQGRTLASFDWVDLGAFVGDSKAAQVWLALARARVSGQIGVFESTLAPDAPFSIRVHIRPPDGRQPVWGGLVKGVIDGVICAFQAHSDTSVLHEVATRLAKVLPAEAEEIEQLLLDRRWAVLGVVSRLVSAYREGVKWDPADHLCVAGDVLAGEPDGPGWAIKGELIELSR